MLNPPKYCCATFESKVNDAGSRGLAFLAGKAGSKKRFIAQSRGVAFSDEGIMPAIGVAVNISSEVPIGFCPFCGTNLESFIEAYSREFEALSKQHEQFIGMFRPHRE
jgi:Zn ribbon nucleic-acid-binding protein